MSERDVRRVWDFCDNEHGVDNPCQRCESLARAFADARAEGFRAGIEAAAKVGLPVGSDPRRRLLANPWESFNSGWQKGVNDVRAAIRALAEGKDK